MSRKDIPLGEACQRLGIARPTLTRRMERLGIKARMNTLDHRQSYISLTDIERLENTYKTDNERIPNIQDISSTRLLSRQELEDKVKALEDKVRDLAAKILDNSYNALQGESDSASDKRVLDYHPRPARLRTIATGSDTMPENWIPLYTLCDQHGIPSTNVSRAIRKGELPKPHIGEWVYHGTSARNGLDPAMQTAILAWHAKKHGK